MTKTEEKKQELAFYVNCFPQPKENEYVLILLEGGSLDLLFEAEVYHCAAPAVLCFNSKQKWSVINSIDAQAYSAYFRPEFLCRAFTKEFLESCSMEYMCEHFDFLMLLPFVSLKHHASVRNFAPRSVLHQARMLCMECENLLHSKDRFDRYRARMKFIDCLHLCEQMFSQYEHTIREQSVGVNIPEKYRETSAALQIIWENYGDPTVNAAYILDKLGINKEKLNRQFRKVLGCSVYQYILEYRLTMAKQKLIYTEDFIDQISNSCGFTVYITFATIFKRKLGMTPQEYREAERKKQENAPLFV